MFNVTDIQNEIIWYNSNITDQHRLLYFKDWHEKGIFKVSQLLFENGSWKDLEHINEMLTTKAAFILILRRQNQRFETLIQNADPKRR